MLTIRVLLLSVVVNLSNSVLLATEGQSYSLTALARSINKCWVASALILNHLSPTLSAVLPGTTPYPTVNPAGNRSFVCPEHLNHGTQRLRYVEACPIPMAEEDDRFPFEHTSYHDGPHHRMGYWMDLNGCMYPVESDFEQLSSGDLFDLEVSASGHVESFEHASSTDHEALRPYGDKRTLVMVANSNRDVTWSMEESARLFLSQSYGNLRFSYDYLRINAEISCNLGILCNRFKTEASRSVSLSNYDSFTIVMSSNSCPYGGMAFVGGNCLSVQSYSNKNLASVKMHEDGHNLGGGHGNKNGVAYKDYDDALSGSYRTRTGFNAPHRIQFKWLDYSQVALLTEGNHSLWNLDDVDSNQNKVVVLISGEYTVSFRAVDNDYFSSEVDGQMIEIHHHTGGSSPTNLIKELRTGEWYTLSNQTHIKFIRIEGKQAWIEVKEETFANSNGTVMRPELVIIALSLMTSFLSFGF